MKTRNIRPETTTIGRFTVDNYSVTNGDHRIVLSIINGSTRPLFAGYFKEGNLEQMFQYVQYDLQLPPDLSLFIPPEGITIREATPSDRTPIQEVTP